MFAVGLFLFAQQVPLSPLTDGFTFLNAILSTLVFGVIGIALAILGFKLFDMLTPGKLEEEIVQKQNIAAAILGASIILGICLIVSRAMS
jgi:putative membrane protein